MGAYTYCFKCSVLLRDKDFAKGKAFKIGENVACSKCAADLVPAATPPVPKPSGPARATSKRIQAVASEELDDAVFPPVPGRRKLLVGLAGGGFVLLAGVLFVLLLKGKSPPSAPAVVVVPPAPLPAAPASTVRESSARAALLRARKSAEDKPVFARALEEVVLAWEGTAVGEEARRELAAVRTKIREDATAALAALDAELAEPLAREEFGTILDRIEASLKKIDAPEWVSGLNLRRGDVDSKARGLLSELSRKAAAHKAVGETAELEKLVARIDAWKLPALLATLKTHLEDVVAAAPAPPKPKARSAEAESYLKAWRVAAAKATVRDYAAGAAALRKASAGLQEEDVRKEAAGDLDDLQRLGDLHQRLMEAALALPLGKALSVELRSADGPRRVSGVLVRISRDRAELKTGKGPAFVEWEEATPAGLASLARGSDPHLVALLSLMEGDVEGAKALVKPDDLPEKAWAYGATAKPPPPSHDEARELYYAAERGFASMETRGPAVEKYRTLKNDFATSAVVRGDLERILRRSDAGKEYLLGAADARLSGTFTRSKDGSTVSAKDSDAENTLDNVVEVEFYALPGTSYRAWLHLGGCCREVLTYYLQGTEMTAADKGRKVSIEPGENRADLVVSSAAGLKKDHKEHAKNKEPKAPARWDWVSLVLPKYATPGLKKICLATNQQGFGVRQILVSSVRTAVPKPAELEELQKARLLDVPPVVGDPDLLLHWTFDEPVGVFADESGNGLEAVPQGGVTRGAGKLGGAAVFDGGGGYVLGKDAPELRITGDLTIAFWMRKDAEVGDWVRLFGKGTGEKRNYGVWEDPGDGKRILWQIYREAGGAMVSMNSTGTTEVGRWHHVACVRQGKLAIIYLDGRKDAEAVCDGVPATMDAPVTAGFGAGAGHTHLKGALDDIRLYRRALTREEISALFEMGQ